MIADVLLPYKPLLLHIIGIWDCLKSKTEFYIFSLSIFFHWFFLNKSPLHYRHYMNMLKTEKKYFTQKAH